jgi:hypothetical protein
LDFDIEATEIERDFTLLGSIHQARAEFSDCICSASSVRNTELFSFLRLDNMYQFVEFFYNLKVQKIVEVEKIELLVNLHNMYLERLLKDKDRMVIMGLTRDRVMKAIVTGEILPRLLDVWRESPGTIDQSNLARLLAVTMSTETVRKNCEAAAYAGFLEMRREKHKPTYIRSNGIMETVFGKCLRDLRIRIEGKGESHEI